MNNGSPKQQNALRYYLTLREQHIWKAAVETQRRLQKPGAPVETSDRIELALCLVMVLYSVLIVAMVDGWIGEALRQSLIVWLPPSLIMLAYRWWLIPVSDAGVVAEDNYGALCAGRE